MRLVELSGWAWLAIGLGGVLLLVIGGLVFVAYVWARKWSR